MRRHDSLSAHGVELRHNGARTVRDMPASNLDTRVTALEEVAEDDRFIEWVAREDRARRIQWRPVRATHEPRAAEEQVRAAEATMLE